MVLCAQLFVDEFAKKINLPYEISEDLDGNYTAVTINCNGYKTVLYFEGVDGKYVSIHTFIERAHDDKLESIYAVCNSLNAEYRWLKFYVNKDNYVLASDNAILCKDSAAAECGELLLSRFQIVEKAKPLIMRAIWT